MPRAAHQPASRRGSILLAVLVLVAVMTIGGLAYFNWTTTERQASNAFARQLQAQATAASGVDYLRVFLADERNVIEQKGGLFDNPARLRGVLLQDSDAAPLRTRFSLLAPGMNSLGLYDGYRFGVEDESARINLNTILFVDDYDTGSLDEETAQGARRMLTSLPGVTDSIADSILDWIDEDDEPRPFGAERSYYSSLATPYAPANRPLESLDQLLFVRGMTEALLYGRDRDHNFQVDEREEQNPLPTSVDNSDGAADRGLAAYLTLNSAERNVDDFGEPKIDVNQQDLEALHTAIERAISTEAANFVVAFRQGGSEGNPRGGTQGGRANNRRAANRLASGPRPGGAANTRSARDVQIDFDAPANQQITSLLSLIGTTATLTERGSDQPITVESPFSDRPAEMLGYLPALFDNLTVTSEPVMAGRVNINQASRAVLAGLPGMPPEAVDAILSSRTPDGGSTQPLRQHGVWLLAEGLVELDAMRALEPFVTGRGDVYRAQIVGFFDAGGVAARHEVVVDATGDLPVLRRRKDLTPLGAGFTAEELGAPQ